MGRARTLPRGGAIRVFVYRRLVFGRALTPCVGSRAGRWFPGSPTLWGRVPRSRVSASGYVNVLVLLA